MKLVVFASVPPPAYGQSLAVQAMLAQLRADPDFDVLHVDPHLSRDHADIGRWRPGKLFALLAACGRCWLAMLRHGRRPIYYVPAPAKRAALYRDWLVMLLCRPLARGLILHWHAVGLGEWLHTRATAPERWLTQLLLGRAALSLVLDATVQADAAALAPRQVAVVPNGFDDPAPGFERPGRPPVTAAAPLEILFIGLGVREKGLFDTLDAVDLALRAGLACRLTVAGAFADAETERSFAARAAALPAGTVRHLGFVAREARFPLFAQSDVLCFPTYYPHENQPLVLLEALAFDLPFITTPWRSIPGLLPADAADAIALVPPRAPDEIARALTRLATVRPAPGRLRAHFIAHFTAAHRDAALKAAFRSLRRD